MSNRFEAMSDRDLFGDHSFWSAPGSDDTAEKQIAELHAERDRRIRLKEQERQAKEQARLERLKVLQQVKDALPFSDSLAQEIADRISAGELLINICRDEYMPTVRRVNGWLRDHSDFAALYSVALNDRYSVWEEELISIPDEGDREFDEVVIKGQKRRVRDPVKATWAKMRVDMRLRHLKSGKPSKWSDVSTLITKEADPYDAANLSPDELERQIADIEQKSRIRKVA